MSYRCCEVFVYCKGWLHETAGRDEKFRQLKLRQKVMYAPLFPARLVLSFRCDAPRTSFFLSSAAAAAEHFELTSAVLVGEAADGTVVNG